MTDMAARKSPDEVNAADIVSKHVTEFAQNLIGKLRCRGRKRAREAAESKKKGSKRAQRIETYIGFSVSREN